MTDKQVISHPMLKAETHNPGSGARHSRPFVYELNPLRATTALVVVAVHVLAFTAALNSTALGLQLQNALVVAVHYTREMFMFVTAFALVYVYYGKPFSATRFWKRRMIGVLLPYCIWSIFYVCLTINTSLLLPSSRPVCSIC
jgi:probable poly-beta-1,6-N-acetyl-D-glucosamine export protein